MNKPKGGRGVKQAYTTSVMRVPDPIRPEVEQLIQDFYKEKPVTSLKQLSIDDTIELYSLAYPNGVKCEGYSDSIEQWEVGCPLESEWWNESYDKFWEEKQRPVLERFTQLADRVNLCIWQIDNSFALTCPSDWYGSKGDIRDAISRLIKYGLIAYFDAKPVTAFELAQWIVDPKLNDRIEDYERMVMAALDRGRKDVLKALRVGDMPPVDRRGYWFKFYSENMGKSGVNYWDWVGNPELDEFSPELSNLLQLSRPEGDLLSLLHVLRWEKDLFRGSGSYINGQWVLDLFTLTGEAVGQFGMWEPKRKDELISNFRAWHTKGVKKLGLTMMKQIYMVCFSANWEFVNKILSSPSYVQLQQEKERQERERAWKSTQDRYRGQRASTNWASVLGVAVTATKEQVKKAYRDLCKQYHPDVCAGGEEKMKEINNAYAEWEKYYQVA
jgi:hypothetical protein